jgi:peptidoglycan/LPS O-acetylase OafA/YrhL
VLVVLGGLAIWRAAFGDPGPFVEHFGTALPALAAGMALAVLAAGARARPELAARLATVSARPLLWWGAAAAAYLVLSSRDFTLLQPTASEQAWQWTWESIVAFLVVAPLVLARRAGPAEGVTRFLSWRPVAWVGLVSYGLYLWHGWCLSFIERDQLHHAGLAGTLRAGGLVGLAYLGALGMAALSWYLLERPLLRAVARLVGGQGSTAPVRLGTP